MDEGSKTAPLPPPPPPPPREGFKLGGSDPEMEGGEAKEVEHKRAPAGQAQVAAKAASANNCNGVMEMMDLAPLST